MAPVSESNLMIESILVKPGETVCRVNFVIKRILDLIISVAALLVFAPVMLIAFIALKLSSPTESAIFRQDRVTRDGRVFQMMKFRTMIANAEQHTGPVWTVGVDHRVTRLGQWLRLTHIDEMPQLFNVLSGDMSIVGPRPERPVFVDQFAQTITAYENHHQVKTGITGYAQIKNPYPDMEFIRDKTAWDLYYIENWSLRLELWIIWETAAHLFESLGDLIARKVFRMKPKPVLTPARQPVTQSPHQ